MWAETPDYPLAIKPHDVIEFSSNLDEASRTSFLVKNRDARAISYRIKVLSPEACHYRLSRDMGLLKHKQGVKIKIERPAGIPPIGEETLLIEHILMPEGYDNFEASWYRAQRRKVEPWHHLIRIKHTGDVNDSKGGETSSNMQTDSQPGGQPHSSPQTASTCSTKDSMAESLV